MSNKRVEQLENLLAKFLHPVENVPFEIFIRAWFNYKVIQFDPENNSILFELLKTLGKNTCLKTTESNILSNRPNEVGNKIEDYVIFAGQHLELDIRKPKGSGYPDLKFQYNCIDTYIEVKSYHQNSVDSKFRSFYLSPPKRPRIDSDGFHIIMGFEIEKIDSNHYCAKGFHLADAYGLNCSMKFEAQSSNVEVYSEKQVLYSWDGQN